MELWGRTKWDNIGNNDNNAKLMIAMTIVAVFIILNFIIS